MPLHVRVFLSCMFCVGFLMIAVLTFHIGHETAYTARSYVPLLGAVLGGGMVLFSVHWPAKQEELWMKRERTSWTLIGCGCIGWGIGEAFWRYYVLHGQHNPFPSLADIGYASFFPLVFTGLLLQPALSGHTKRRVFLLLDSLIAAGALLSIAWFLLLGELAQKPTEALPGKFLLIYYLVTDVALLSCLLFLYLREGRRIRQISAHRLGLLLLGIGLSIYATSDFLFYVLQNAGLTVDGTVVDLGWPLGMMTMGVAAYMRRFYRSTTVTPSLTSEGRWSYKPDQFGLPQAIPYLLVAIVFLVLTINVFSPDRIQHAIRPVLVTASLVVVSLVILRQIITIQENLRLTEERAHAFERLEKAHREIERSKKELEEGVNYLKEIQTRLANGDVRARARVLKGDLWPLASGLNLMADRMMHAEQRQRQAQKLIRAIIDLSLALEQRRGEKLFVLPASCLDAPPEFQHLLRLLGFRPITRLSSFYKRSS